MKTNKERAELILAKAKTLKEAGQVEVLSSKKKPALWKVVTAIACVLVVVAGAITGLVIGLINSGYNIDKMYIANFNSYKAIGAGYINSTGKTASASGLSVAYAASSNDGGEKYLMGQKEDGSFEKIAFSKTQNGKPEKQQQGYITNILSFNRFTFLEWNRIKNEKSEGEWYKSFRNDYNDTSKDAYKTFILDNKTGKIFDLKSVQIYRFDFEPNGEYGMGKYEGGNCVYFDFHPYFEDKAIYKVSVENGDLKIEKVISNKEIQFYDFFSDKYGNLFVNENYYISNRNVMNLSKTVFKSLNGVVYSEDGMKVNENGEFVDTSFVDSLYLEREDMIKKVGNVEYYYSNKPYKKENIYKITWRNEEEFSCEVIPVEAYTEEYVTTDDKIYFLKEENIFAVEIETGKKIEQEIGAGYIFYNISTDNLGNVLFDGMKKQGMVKVKGIIYNNGQIDISLSKVKYVVYYIKPLN